MAWISHRHTGPLNWWHPADWTIGAGSSVCSSTHVFQRVRHKVWVLRGPLHHWNIHGGSGSEHAETAHLKWSTGIIFTMPTMKNKAECLVGLIRFWRQHTLYLGILLSWYTDDMVWGEHWTGMALHAPMLLGPHDPVGPMSLEMYMVGRISCCVC